MSADVFPRRFEGLSTQDKPAGLSNTSVFDELDTGLRYVWDVSDREWQLRGRTPTGRLPDGPAPGETEALLRTLIAEVRAMRLGMIESGYCAAVDPESL